MVETLHVTSRKFYFSLFAFPIASWKQLLWFKAFSENADTHTHVHGLICDDQRFWFLLVFTRPCNEPQHYQVSRWAIDFFHRVRSHGAGASGIHPTEGESSFGEFGDTTPAGKTWFLESIYWVQNVHGQQKWAVERSNWTSCFDSWGTIGTFHDQMALPKLQDSSCRCPHRGCECPEWIEGEQHGQTRFLLRHCCGQYICRHQLG